MDRNINDGLPATPDRDTVLEQQGRKHSLGVDGGDDYANVVEQEDVGLVPETGWMNLGDTDIGAVSNDLLDKPEADYMEVGANSPGEAANTTRPLRTATRDTRS